MSSSSAIQRSNQSLGKFFTCLASTVFRFLPNSETAGDQTMHLDNYYKGKPRPYSEAKSLHVIDERIESLVDAMNCEPFIWTTGSCQGHGRVYIKVPPYVSFKSSIAVASTIATVLRNDYYSPSPKLNYFWELSATFDLNSELTYVINAPVISSGKWFYATRRGLDQDFKSLGSLVQEVLDHFKSKDIVIKREESSSDKISPHEDGIKKAHRKRIKQLLRYLETRLEYKWNCGYGEEIPWNYRDAAYEFHHSTGCKYDSAENYFGLVEAIAEWESFPVPPPKNVKDAIKLNGIFYGRPRAFPLFPDARST